MHVVIAEKNEAARDIAAAICGLGCKPADVELPAEGNGYAVYAASGHLLALDEPAQVDERYARTEIDDLPIEIYPWPKSAHGKYQAGKLAEIGRALRACDGKVYHAGDADDEGQLIVDEILEHFGWDPADTRVMRVYVNDNIPKNIVRAFEAASPNAGHVADGRAAQARALGDFCFGVNESRLASARLKAKVSVGRVQTPTLGLVVERDRAREGHVKRSFYELRCTCERDGETLVFAFKPPIEALEDGKRCFDRAYLEGVASSLAGFEFGCRVGLARKERPAPLPYNLTDLTADMSKRRKMTAGDVMEATQELRDKYKAITYNRAESRHLPEEHLASAPDVLACAASNIGWEGGFDEGRRHAAFDDSKVGAHHGIIPQEKRLDLTEIPGRERAVYTAIATRYLCLFAAPLEYDEATAGAEAAPAGVAGHLEYKSRHLVERGWSEYAPSAWCALSLSEEPAPRAGDAVFKVVSCEIAEKKTAPPEAFTDGTLMVAMSNIARYVHDPEVKRILKEKDERSTTEHGSIGTSATRKDIIEALIARGFVERDGAGKLLSTDKGRRFFDAVPASIRGADLTARWYLMQKEVAEGTLAVRAVMDAVCEEFRAHRESAYVGASLAASAGKCPLCGAGVVKRGRAWSCETNKSEKDGSGEWVEVAGCGFKILPFCGKELSAKQAASLLAGKKVALRGCVSARTGNKFDCSLHLVDGEVKPLFGKGGGKGAKAGRNGSGLKAQRSRKGGW